MRGGGATPPPPRPRGGAVCGGAQGRLRGARASCCGAAVRPGGCEGGYGSHVLRGGGEGAVPSRDGGRGGGGRGGEEGDARRRRGPAATGAEEVRSWARRRRPVLAGAGADAQAQGSRLLRARHRSSRGTGGPDSSGGAGWRRLVGLAAGSVEPSDPRVFKGIL